MSEENQKKKFDIKKIFTKVKFEQTYRNVESNIPSLVITVISAILIMALVCCAVFFARVKGPEKVLVPNVVGLQLEDAIMALQEKKLITNIGLRYSDEVEKGVVISQTPKADTMQKGRSDVTLVVSRGPVLDTVENYVGKNIDEVSDDSDNSKKKLITFNYPIYKYSSSPKGTILAQDIQEGVEVCNSKNVQLIVSKGQEKPEVNVPDLYQKNIADFYKEVQNTNLIYNVTSHLVLSEEKEGTITTRRINETEKEFSQIDVDFAFPAQGSNDLYYGIIEENVIDYPVPVKMTFESISAEGEKSFLTEFYHKGGTVTVPYVASKGTIIYFYINNKIHSKVTVQ